MECLKKEKGTLINSLNMIAKHVAENQNTLFEYA
jgi:hypothetical protein